MTRDHWARMHLAELTREGFDRSKIFNGNQVNVGCRFCFVLWDHDAQPKHYPDCPNRKSFCLECDCSVAPGVKYCADCLPLHPETKPAAGVEIRGRARSG